MQANGKDHSSQEKRALAVNGDRSYDYDRRKVEIVEPTQESKLLHAPGVGLFGSKSSAHGFSSVHSVTSRLSQRLAHAQPTLQSSWVNIATPVPLGASYLGLAKDEADKFKSQEEIAREETAPPDRYRLVYLILLIHGIGTLMPWNMFLTANSYFTDFKLGPKSANETTSEYAKNFLSYLGITAQLPNLILNGINIFCQCGGGKSSNSVRVAGSIIATIAMFILTVILAIVDSDQWQGTFFGVTMASVVVINMCGGVYQNTIYGLAGQLPMKYTNAVIFGSNISGVLTAVIMIITLLGSPNIQIAAIWYFVTAIIILCIALISYFVLPYLNYYRHFFVKPVLERTVGHVIQHDVDMVPEKIPYRKIIKKIWLQLLGVWLTFFVSLTCFPVLQAGIQPADPNFFIPAKLYTPITTFLFFNLFAALGNLFTEWIRKPGPRFVIIPIALRLLFIPFLMFCNFRPDIRTLPVYINNDYAYMSGAILMALSSGYFSSLCMMYAPSLVEPKYAGTAAMISAFFLIFGIIAGVNFTLVIAQIVETA